LFLNFAISSYIFSLSHEVIILALRWSNSFAASVCASCKAPVIRLSNLSLSCLDINLSGTFIKPLKTSVFPLRVISIGASSSKLDKLPGEISVPSPPPNASFCMSDTI